MPVGLRKRILCMKSQCLVYFGSWNPNFELNPQNIRNFAGQCRRDDRILDTSLQCFTLKAMERENLDPGVFGNVQSESYIRYKRNCRNFPK
ncbi:hypothetical protein TNCV_4297121 [Trichonephila clavipes]|nr:hypothetical protein TNCV_4297121 [Trichonephila clavipes]